MYCINLIRMSLLILPLLVVVTSCGGGSSDTPADQKNDTPSTKTGVFVDGPVINIGYRTETIESVTNALGEYVYLPGETVTFFIGNLEFPPVPATGVVTPLELAGTTDTSDPAVVNMIRLLQTLDKNGNPDAIEITEAAKSIATSVDFSLSVADFESSTAVTDLISAAEQDTPVTELVTEADAINNFETGLDAAVSINLTEIIANSVITYSECLFTPGGWKYTFTDSAITLTGSDTWDTQAGCSLDAEEIIPVLVADLTSTDDLPFNCVAYPICKWSDLNKTLSGTDGDGRTFTSTYSFDQNNNKLVYIKEVEGTTFSEVIRLHTENDSSSIIGSWIAIDENGIDYSVVVFLDRSRYIIAHSNNPDPDNDFGLTIPVSAEYGTYTWDAASGALTMIALGQSDGINGFSEVPSSNVTIDGSNLTLSIDGKTFPFTKISSANSMIGAWAIGSGTEYSVLAFIDDTRYMIAHTNNSEPDAILGATVPVSAEYGTYTWDTTSGAFTATMQGQSDGEGGLSNSRGNLTISVNLDKLTLTDSIDGAATISRVE